LLRILVCCLAPAVLAQGCTLFEMLPIIRKGNPLSDVRNVAVIPVRSVKTFEGLDLERFGETLASELQHHRGFVVRTPEEVTRFLVASGKSYVLPNQARDLAVDMKVDAVIVAVITHYDPYDPPKVGMSSMMFFAHSKGFSPADLSMLERSGMQLRLASEDLGSMAAVTDVVDARERPTNMKLDFFAARMGDTKDRPLGKRAYLLIMSNYEIFVCHTMVEKLLKHIDDKLGKIEKERNKERKRQEEMMKSKRRMRKKRAFEW